ncbi:YpuI family protein [Paenibacillus sp. MMS20-IR301]|uniref:YpuI family protein n=1 Tax=Paenibacillus sp. MMS20-IR301 TaxID=2895946 RepID=UPI0028EB90BF|nr:YpuI family protein [Paenibacillus sp. MMS20-IR301]WNS43793.1 YpuI family protein [Paenibacillus sp. MMS20-IR301]
MSAANVQKLCESTRDKLKSVIGKMELFLNEHALPQLVTEGDEETLHFYQGFLSDLRHLLVFSEMSSEKLGVALRRANFDEAFAQKALYNVYHFGVNNFFYPKNESYSEDGRYAYTGQDAIRFRKKPVRPARDIIMEITKVYEELRDDLSYYENDYLTEKRMQNQV